MLKKLKHSYYLRLAQSGKANDKQQLKIILRKDKKEIISLITHQAISGEAQEALMYHKINYLVRYADCGNKLYNRKILDAFIKNAPLDSLVTYMRKYSLIGSYLSLSLRKDWADVIESYLVDKNANVAPDIEVMIVGDVRLRNIFLQDRYFKSLAANRKYLQILNKEGQTEEAAKIAEVIKFLEANRKSI